MSSSGDGTQPVPRTFSSIDDGLNLLLADLKQEEGGSQGREMPLLLHSFTPFLKMASLDCDPFSRLASPPGGAAAAVPPAGPLLATASSYTVLKGAGSATTPLILPNAFIPVPMAAAGALGGKLRPGGGAPPLHMAHQPGSGPAFAIPAYGRPFTQLDFISPEDFDVSVGVTVGPPGCSPGGLLGRGGGCGLADFSELADESRLGELPSDADLRLLLFDPVCLPAAATGKPCGGAHSVAGLAHAAAVMQGQQEQQYHQQQFVQYLQQQQQQGPADLPSNPSARSSATFADPRPQQPAGDTPARRAPVLRIKTGAGASGGARSAAAALGAADGGRQHSPKRRAELMDTDSPRARTSKRLSGGAGSVGWSEASQEGGSGCSTPSSAAGDGSGAADPSWFTGLQQWGGGSSGGLAPTRFGVEHGRRQAGRAPADEDPCYLPAPQRSARLAGTPRQQHQPQPQQQCQQQGVASATEDEPTAQQQQQQQFRGVSRHRLTQRWEASLWLNGRQLYLGGFNSQEDAAHAYDLAALACKGLDAQINFAPADYAEQLREVAGFTRDEVVAYVRRRSSAFSRGRSKFRGVSGHNGRWEARIGSFSGRKNVSFGVFDSEEGAARQYDRALILEKGRTAKTNFPIRDYDGEAADYEAYLLRVCGSFHSPAARQEAAAVTLPRDREATADEKKRSAVIYAEALLRSLRQPAPAPRGGRT